VKQGDQKVQTSPKKSKHFLEAGLMCPAAFPELLLLISGLLCRKDPWRKGLGLMEASHGGKIWTDKL
jgi:hypothetical protein